MAPGSFCIRTTFFLKFRKTLASHVEMTLASGQVCQRVNCTCSHFKRYGVNYAKEFDGNTPHIKQSLLCAKCFLAFASGDWSYTKQGNHKTQHIQERSYTRHVIYQTCHIQDSSYTRQVIYKTGHIENRSYTRHNIYTKSHIQDRSYTRQIIYNVLVSSKTFADLSPCGFECVVSQLACCPRGACAPGALKGPQETISMQV